MCEKNKDPRKVIVEKQESIYSLPLLADKNEPQSKLPGIVNTVNSPPKLISLKSAQKSLLISNRIYFNDTPKKRRSKNVDTPKSGKVAEIFTRNTVKVVPEKAKTLKKCYKTKHWNEVGNMGEPTAKKVYSTKMKNPVNDRKSLANKFSIRNDGWFEDLGTLRVNELKSIKKQSVNKTVSSTKTSSQLDEFSITIYDSDDDIPEIYSKGFIPCPIAPKKEEDVEYIGKTSQKDIKSFTKNKKSHEKHHTERMFLNDSDDESPIYYNDVILGQSSNSVILSNKYQNVDSTDNRFPIKARLPNFSHLRKYSPLRNCSNLEEDLGMIDSSLPPKFSQSPNYLKVPKSSQMQHNLQIEECPQPKYRPQLINNYDYSKFKDSLANKNRPQLENKLQTKNTVQLKIPSHLATNLKLQDSSQLQVGSHLTNNLQIPSQQGANFQISTSSQPENYPQLQNLSNQGNFLQMQNCSQIENGSQPEKRTQLKNCSQLSNISQLKNGVQISSETCSLPNEDYSKPQNFLFEDCSLILNENSIMNIKLLADVACKHSTNSNNSKTIEHTQNQNNTKLTDSIIPDLYCEVEVEAEAENKQKTTDNSEINLVETEVKGAEINKTSLEMSDDTIKIADTSNGIFEDLEKLNKYKNMSEKYEESGLKDLCKILDNKDDVVKAVELISDFPQSDEICLERKTVEDDLLSLKKTEDEMRIKTENVQSTEDFLEYYEKFLEDIWKADSNSDAKKININKKIKKIRKNKKVTVNLNLKNISKAYISKVSRIVDKIQKPCDSTFFNSFWKELTNLSDIKIKKNKTNTKEIYIEPKNANKFKHSSTQTLITQSSSNSATQTSIVYTKNQETFVNFDRPSKIRSEDEAPITGIKEKGKTIHDQKEMIEEQKLLLNQQLLLFRKGVKTFNAFKKKFNEIKTVDKTKNPKEVELEKSKNVKNNNQVEAKMVVGVDSNNISEKNFQIGVQLEENKNKTVGGVELEDNKNVSAKNFQTEFELEENEIVPEKKSIVAVDLEECKIASKENVPIAVELEENKNTYTNKMVMGVESKGNRNVLEKNFQIVFSLQENKAVPKNISSAENFQIGLELGENKMFLVDEDHVGFENRVRQKMRTYSRKRTTLSEIQNSEKSFGEDTDTKYFSIDEKNSLKEIEAKGNDQCKKMKIEKMATASTTPPPIPKKTIERKSSSPLIKKIATQSTTPPRIPKKTSEKKSSRLLIKKIATQSTIPPLIPKETIGRRSSIRLKKKIAAQSTTPPPIPKKTSERKSNHLLIKKKATRPTTPIKRRTSERLIIMTLMKSSLEEIPVNKINN